MSVARGGRSCYELAAISTQILTLDYQTCAMPTLYDREYLREIYGHQLDNIINNMGFQAESKM